MRKFNYYYIPDLTPVELSLFLPLRRRVAKTSPPHPIGTQRQKDPSSHYESDVDLLLSQVSVSWDR